MARLDDKDPAETVAVTADFSGVTATVSSASVSAIRWGGAEDLNPGAIIIGTPVIRNTQVIQKIQGGVEGCIYALRFFITVPDGTSTVDSCLIPVVKKENTES